MDQRLSRLKRGIVGKTALCGVGAGFVLLTAGVIAQTPIPPATPPAPTQGKTTDAKPARTSPDSPASLDANRIPLEATKPPPGNPLVLGDSVNSTPLPTQGVPKSDFKDYRQGYSVGPIDAKTGKPLPLFGYDFFRPARDIIDAHRAYVKRVQQNRADGIMTNRPNGSNARNNDDLNNEPGRRNDNYDSSRDRQVGSSGSGRRNSDSGNDGNGRQMDDGNGSGSGSGSRSRDNNDSGSSTTSRSNERVRTYDPLDINRDYSDTSGQRNARNNGTVSTSSDNALVSDSRMDVSDPLSQLINNFATSIPVNYQIGPGDTVRFSYWSPTIERSELVRVVDPQGAITIEGLAPIVLLGKTVASAEATLQQQLRRFYKNVQVSLTLDRLRTIQVTVTGEVYMGGTYTVPSVASAYNLLFASGGPTENGSLRDVEVLRAGKKVGTVDMYKVELGAAQTPDIPLQPGDMIVVPPRKARVAVSGEVLRPAVFELIDAETLDDALRYAGGIRPSGLNQSVRINTVDPGNARIIQDVNVKDVSAVKAQKLYDGDSVEVFSVRSLLTNEVSVEGAVDQPNNYPMTPNMRVSDLLLRARGTLNEAYLQRAELRRWNPDTTTTLYVIDLEKALEHDPQNDLPLQKWDRLKVYTRDEVAYLGRRMVTVKGAVVKEGIYPVSRNMHVSDLLRAAGGPTPDANLERAFLIHQPDNAAPINVSVNLSALQRGGADPEVLDNDQLIVYNVRQAQFTPEHIVQIVGEVVTPGSYPRAQNMKLSELLHFSGGLLPGAGGEVAVAHARHSVDDPAEKSVTKVQLDAGHVPAQADIVLQDGDVVSVSGVGGFVPTVQKVQIRGAVAHPGYVILTNKQTYLTDVLKEVGGLRPEAYARGAEFYRNPDQLSSGEQKRLVLSIGMLNDLLNGSEYQRELAKSRLQIIKATGEAQAGNLLIPSSTATTVPNAAAGTAGTQLANQNLVTPARPSASDVEKPDGNIAVNLPNALLHPRTKEDIILLDGDTITIPDMPTTVQIVGAVFHQRGVQYRPGESLQQYVDEAGGFAPDAARDRIEVIRLGGGLVPAKKAGPIQPGDVILVPTKVLAAKISSNSDTIGEFFRTLTSSALIYKFATSIFGL